MLFEVNKAKKMIEQLLKNDSNYYKKWLEIINEFNDEQLEKLLNGKQNFDYGFPKEDIEDLIMKFDNFKLLTQQWYNKEDHYKYLIPLWKNYICIERLKNLNKEKRIKYFESKSINYSEWPNEIKSEFNELLNDTINTKVYKDKEIYNKKQTIEKLLNKLKEIKESCKIDKKNTNTNKEEEIKSIMLDIMKSPIVKELVKYLGPLAPIITIANETFSFFGENNNNNCKDNNFKVNNCNNIKVLDDLIDDDYDDYFSDHDSIINEEKGFSASDIFGNRTVYAIHFGLSLINLYESYNNFHDIKEKIKEIKNNDYKGKIEEIVSKFNEHIEEINKINFNCNLSQISFLIEQIYSIINNIQNDHKNLIKKLEEIEIEIEFLESKQKNSRIGLGKSILYGAFGVAGTIMTGGLIAIGYGISTVANGISGILNGISLYDCHKTIKDLKKLVTRIYEENEKFTKTIEDLTSKINNRSIDLPDYLENVEKLLTKNKKIEN